jgi:4-diphosphocytidyl-2-C-methyl-D-erythritol kinase
MKIHVLAYAKLNLFLNVCSKRPNGFHEIQSLVQTIDLADRIRIERASDVRVVCNTELAGPNIVESAVRELLQEKQTQSGVAIWIEKNIPIGAGLGGGSSDAAAVLAVVNQLIPPQVSESRLSEIAGRIGSDVPLFLAGGCVSLAGLGHPERRHSLRTETFVLLVPDVHCSTKEIYSAWQPDDSTNRVNELGRNDLAPAAARIYPELGDVAHIMSKLGGLYSGMTGSGSAFFAAFPNRMEAASAVEQLTRQELGSRVYYCQPTRSGFTELTE